MSGLAIAMWAGLVLAPQGEVQDEPHSSELPSALAPFECPATAMLEEAQAGVPETEDTRGLRGRIGYGLSEARGSEREPGLHRSLERCHKALLVHAELAEDVYGPQRGASEAKHAEALAAQLEPRIVATEPVVVEPQRSPEDAWTRRRGALIGHTTASAIVTLTGALMVILPWAVDTDDCGDPDADAACGDAFGPLIVSTIGGGLILAGVIPLGIWAHRLRRHHAERPPGLTLFNGKARLQLAGQGLRLRF